MSKLKGGTRGAGKGTTVCGKSSVCVSVCVCVCVCRGMTAVVHSRADSLVRAVMLFTVKFAVCNGLVRPHTANLTVSIDFDPHTANLTVSIDFDPHTANLTVSIDFDPHTTKTCSTRESQSQIHSQTRRL